MNRFARPLTAPHRPSRPAPSARRPGRSGTARRENGRPRDRRGPPHQQGEEILAAPDDLLDPGFDEVDLDLVLGRLRAAYHAVAGEEDAHGRAET